MKKLIAMLACLTMVLTMFAGLTVSAADYGTPTVSLTYTGDNSKGYAQISVKYSGFENFVEFDQDYYDNEGYSIVTGIAAMSANFTADNGAKYQGGAKKLCTVSTAASGVQSCNTFAAGFDGYITATEGEMAVIRYEITDKTKDTTITLTDAEFTVTAVVDDEIVDQKVYKLADVTVVPCVIPGESVETDYTVTVNADSKAIVGTYADKTTGTVEFTATPAFGYKLNVTADKGNVTFDPAGGTVKVENIDANVTITVAVENVDTAVVATKYVDGSKAYIFGKANFAASAYGVAVEINGAVVNDPANGVADGKYAATANANGAFGVAFDVTGKVFKGDWSVKAYADESESTAVTFAIN